jgi:hypothetical protein
MWSIFSLVHSRLEPCAVNKNWHFIESVAFKLWVHYDVWWRILKTKPHKDRCGETIRTKCGGRWINCALFTKSFVSLAPMDGVPKKTGAEFQNHQISAGMRWVLQKNIQLLWVYKSWRKTGKKREKM